MESWEFEFEYLRTQHYVKEQLKQETLPDMNMMLLLIGLQELGRWKKSLSKEEKQDLMHIAVCRLLSIKGYYRFKGRDGDGWPHFEQLKPIDFKGEENQEQLLKELVIQYFDHLQAEHNRLLRKSSKNKSIKHEEE